MVLRWVRPPNQPTNPRSLGRDDGVGVTGRVPEHAEGGPRASWGLLMFTEGCHILCTKVTEADE